MKKVFFLIVGTVFAFLLSYMTAEARETCTQFERWDEAANRCITDTRRASATVAGYREMKESEVNTTVTKPSDVHDSKDENDLAPPSTTVSNSALDDIR